MHIYMETLVDKRNPKSPQKSQRIFHCKTCDVTTSHRGDWRKHLLTAKHQRAASGSKKPRKSPKLICSYCSKWRICVLFFLICCSSSKSDKRISSKHFRYWCGLWLFAFINIKWEKKFLWYWDWYQQKVHRYM